MIKKYYASVTFGLEKIAAEALRDSGAREIRVLDSAVVFSCLRPVECGCVNNLFEVFAEYPAKDIVSAAKKAANVGITPIYASGITFRVIFMDCGKLCAVPNEDILKLERNITKATKLRPSRAKPDIEIWLNRRNDSNVFYMARLNKRLSLEKSLQKGELKPDICEVMIKLANPCKRDTACDPFGGSGAIAAHLSGKVQKVFTGDNDDARVEFMKKRLVSYKNCEVRKWDALNLPFTDHSLNLVVTDPPWGEFKSVDNGFYRKFIGEASRVIRKGGGLVFLTSAAEEAENELYNMQKAFQKTELKINGKTACLYSVLI